MINDKFYVQFSTSDPINLDQTQPYAKKVAKNLDENRDVDEFRFLFGNAPSRRMSPSFMCARLCRSCMNAPTGAYTTGPTKSYSC